MHGGVPQCILGVDVGTGSHGSIQHLHALVGDGEAEDEFAVVDIGLRILVDGRGGVSDGAGKGVWVWVYG